MNGCCIASNRYLLEKVCLRVRFAGYGFNSVSQITYDKHILNPASSQQLNPSSHTDACVALVSTRGYSITEFTMGNIEFQRNLKQPWGTALDPRDGSVFIANFGANTVLKYCV